MTRRFLQPLLALLLFGGATAVPASPKPCRDASGRVIPCAKGTKPAPSRCKNAAGRFVRCGAPDAHPVEASRS